MSKVRLICWATCAALAHSSLAADSAITTLASDTPLSSKDSHDVPAVASECRPPKIEYEDVAVSFDGGEPMWKVGNAVGAPPGQSLTEFIREGEDIRNWSELFTLHNFIGSSALSPPEASLDFLKALREKRCPGTTQWNIIEKGPHSILYEWQSRPCQGWPEQHEVARILYGTYNWWSIRYVAKRYQLAPEVRSRWIARFSEIKIVLRCR